MPKLSHALAVAVAALLPAAARAHCDTLDGPVVKAGQVALETGRPGPALAWVQPADEVELRATLVRARKVRALGPEALALADRAFLETLVRLHRAGEGAPYTGLAAAGLDLGPAIPAADRAASTRSPGEVEALLVKAVRDGLRHHLERLRRETPPGDDLAAGRAWVAAYVPFVHWVEAVHAAAAGGGHHGGQAAGHPEHGQAEPEAGSPSPR